MPTTCQTKFNGFIPKWAPRVIIPLESLSSNGFFAIYKSLHKLGHKYYIHALVSVTNFCLEFTPGWVVDVGVPHLLIGVQLLACLKDSLLAIWGSGSGFENLRRGRICCTVHTAWRINKDVCKGGQIKLGLMITVSC